MIWQRRRRLKVALFARILHVAVHVGMDYACILECVKSLSMRFVRILRDKKITIGKPKKGLCPDKWLDTEFFVIKFK